MRYIESKDINGKPIFEGDVLSLTIKDKFFGGSYFGKFCDFYNVDEARIQVLENDNFLQVKSVVTFYKENQQIVTNQENAYWEYHSALTEKSMIPEKTLEDFSDVMDATGFSKLETEGTLFFRYLISKGVEKLSGFDGEPILSSEESFLIKTKLDEDIYVGDKIIVKLNEEWKEKLLQDIDSESYLIEDFSHALFEFEKMPEQFDYRVNVYLTDADSNCKVFLKRLNKKGEEKKSQIADKMFRLKESDPLYKEYRDEAGSLYKKEEFIYFEKYKLFLGIKGEVSLLNHFKNNEFEIRKLGS